MMSEISDEIPPFLCLWNICKHIVIFPFKFLDTFLVHFGQPIVAIQIQNLLTYNWLPFKI